MQTSRLDEPWLKVLIGFLITLVVGFGAALMRIRVSVPGTLRTLEKRMEERHKENTEEIEKIRDSVDQLTALIRGVYGEGGMIADAKIDRKRRHKLGNQLLIIMFQLQELSVWAAKTGSKIDVPFTAYPIPSRDLLEVE